MKRSDLEEAILLLADKCNQKESFIKLMEAKIGMPKLVEMIVYQLFLNRFDSRSCSNEEYGAYGEVYSYAKELSQNGFVTFQKTH